MAVVSSLFGSTKLINKVTIFVSFLFYQDDIEIVCFFFVFIQSRIRYVCLYMYDYDNEKKNSG